MRKGLQWHPPNHPHPTPSSGFFNLWSLFHWKNALHHIIFTRGRRWWRADGSISVCSRAAGRHKTSCIFHNWVDADTNPLTYVFPGLLLSCSVKFSWSVQNSVVEVKLEATCYARASITILIETLMSLHSFVLRRLPLTEWANQQFPVCPVRL